MNQNNKDNSNNKTNDNIYGYSIINPYFINPFFNPNYLNLLTLWLRLVQGPLHLNMEM